MLDHGQIRLVTPVSVPFLVKKRIFGRTLHDIPVLLLLCSLYFFSADLSTEHSFPTYSQLLLSRLRLSRIPAYLEEKIWSFIKRRNLTSGNKILWIRREMAPKEQFLPFSTIFSKYIFN